MIDVNSSVLFDQSPLAACKSSCMATPLLLDAPDIFSKQQIHNWNTDLLYLYFRDCMGQTTNIVPLYMWENEKLTSREKLWGTVEITLKTFGFLSGQIYVNSHIKCINTYTLTAVHWYGFFVHDGNFPSVGMWNHTARFKENPAKSKADKYYPFVKPLKIKFCLLFAWLW